MNDTESRLGRQANLSGWNLTAALGLMAAAFLIERLAPVENEALPPKREARRDASAAGLATEREDRGRQANSPSEIPAKGWKDVLLRVYANIGDHRILALAAGTTYYSILAIFFRSRQHREAFGPDIRIRSRRRHRRGARAAHARDIEGQSGPGADLRHRTCHLALEAARRSAGP
jgi:hypothetical protein